MRGRDLISIADLTPEETELVLKRALALKEIWRAFRGTPAKVRGDSVGRKALLEAQAEKGGEGHLFGQDLWPSLRRQEAPAPQAHDGESEAEEGQAESGPAVGAEAAESQAEEVEAAAKATVKPPPGPLAGKTLALVFEKPSLRTRVSFDVGMRQLGGECVYVSPAEVGLGTREPVEDVARVLSRYVDCIAARTFEHATVESLAEWSEVPVINALSDGEHPCQALADLLTIVEKKGRLRGVKLAYIGDGNNVARSLCLGAAVMGMEFRIASPPGFELDKSTLSGSRVLGGATGGSLGQTNDPREAASGADVVYTDVWASMGQEEESAGRARAFEGFQVDSQLMAVAKPDAIFMHDLPAHRGEEVAAEVIEGASSVVWEQAENRMHAQKAVLSLVLGGEG